MEALSPSVITRLLRAVYAIEFLIALIATLDFWREVGGGTHLDLMPWMWKFVLSVGMAAAIVKLTAASVEPRSRTVLVWGLVVALFLMAGGLVTYYYHLNEPLDGDEEGAALTAATVDCHPRLLTGRSISRESRWQAGRRLAPGEDRL
ncbi:MAG: hypothetical protein M3Z09_04310 [Acidobacteriota bacterium]|nr:hypothetical protein [Acidobacteriota bacterium]